jgi:ascorbate-specific PTS system EIIC-type component UlaA
VASTLSLAMILVLVVVAAVAVGLLVGRWWAVLASGVVAATTTFMATSTFAIGDRPFISVAILALIGTSIGVMANRRLRAAR